MRRSPRAGYFVQALLVAAVLTSGGIQSTRGQETPAENAHPEKVPGYKEFLDRVQKYVNLHKSVESTLPALKPTDQPELISAHQAALAKKIREARPHARHGEIFTEDARKAFRKSIHEEFGGPHAHGARTTIRQGEPLSEVHLRVNQPYPDGVPFTTVPPTLLLKFPKLPDQVAYRIVGHDLILLDVGANLVVDRIPEIIP
jgi:hypothetical protein